MLVSKFLIRNVSKFSVNKVVFLNSSSFNKKLLSFTSTRKIMNLSSVIDIFEKHVPKHLAETWDNTGLLIEPDKNLLVSTIFFTNDLTEDVLDEALSVKANLIISYHPPLFKPMKAFLSRNWKDRIAMQCISNKVAVYSPHTACDAVKGGVNDWLLSCFDLQESRPLLPSREFLHCVMECLVTSEEQLMQALSPHVDLKIILKRPYDHKMSLKILFPKQSKDEILPLLAKNPDIEVLLIQDCTPLSDAKTGMGRIGKLQTPLKLEECIKVVKKHVGLEHLRVTLGLNKSLDNEVSTVAVCGGSGSTVLQNVSADLYITGEMSHHDLLDVRHAGRSVILCEHSNSERGYLEHLKNQLLPDLPNINLVVSTVDKDPVTIM